MSVHDQTPFADSCAPAHDPLILPRLRLHTAPPFHPNAQAGKPTLQEILPPAPARTTPAADTAVTLTAEPALPLDPVLPGLGPGGSLRSVLACRLEQIRKWGHTPENDRDRPLKDFLRSIDERAHAAREDLQFYPHDIGRIRDKRLVPLAALIFATIDRIDAELEA